jgi:hypothetical protein
LNKFYGEFNLFVDVNLFPAEVQSSGFRFELSNFELLNLADYAAI